MTPIELLDFIFDGVDQEITVFDGDEEVVGKREDLPAELPLSFPVADLVIGEEVYGFQADERHATFAMVKDADVIFVALLDTSTDLNTLPEHLVPEVPLAGGWEFKEMSNTFFSAEIVDEYDTENDNASPEVEASDEDPEVDGQAAPSESEPVEGLSGQGTDSATNAGGPVSENASDAADSADGRGAGEGESGEGREEPEAEAEDPEGGEVVVTWKDAEVIGDPDADISFVDNPVTFMLGRLYGAHDRRNTQDGHWKPVTLSFRQFMDGFDAEKGAAEWGLCRHPVGKDKAGDSIVLGTSVGKARKAKAMSDMFSMGLDIDSGASLDKVLDRIEELGIFCVAYTTFSHGKRGLELQRDEVLRKLKISGDPDLNQIKQYIRDHSKDRFEESFIAKIEIKEQKKQTTKGVVIALDTPPLDKFRLIFPLAEPVHLIDLADTQAASLDVWANKITGLARNILGVHFDTSCTDPSRLFFLPRHPKDGEWDSVVVSGRPLTFDEIEPMKKSLYTSKRDDQNPFEMVGGESEDKPPMALAPSGMSLNAWHTRVKDRFQIADLLESYCSDKIRVAGGEAEGSVHIECPFEHEHSEEGGTACMAINALDSESEYWTWFCHHDSCQNRHKLEFVEEALRQGWFEESLLKDDEFVMDAGEEEPEPEPEPATEKTPVDEAAEFTKDTPEVDIRKFLKRLVRQEVDMTVQANVTNQLADSTALNRSMVKGLWKDVKKEYKDTQKSKDSPVADFDGVAMVNDWDFMTMCEYGHRRIHDENAKKPQVFHYMEGLCVIREDSEGHAIMRFLNKDMFMNLLNRVSRWGRTVGEEKVQGVSAPQDVVTFLFASDYGTYPELRGLVSTPTFTNNGRLLREPGYDPESRLYYHPDQSLIVPEVSKEPTEDEVYEAKRLIVEEILADFPLGALSRPEIEDRVMRGEGVPAVSNMMALMLLPFMREMIDGPTPGHLLTKPAPGTGASLLTDVFSTITTGRVTPAMAMPSNKDEMSKTLTSVLSNGQGIVFFDNISNSVDSGELASAMTTPTYQARILGRSQTIEVDVRCAWVFTGNNVTLSSELVRRLIMIDLDTRSATPENRTGFRHADVRGWAQENRGDLVWACLTMIQNWIAKGCPEQEDEILASYENWSRIMGGILKEAGFLRFMENRSELKSKADDAEDDEIRILLDIWKDEYGSKHVYTKSTDTEQGVAALLDEHDLMVPGVRRRPNADGDNVSDPAALGRALTKYKDRVFKLEDGTEVLLERGDTKSKYGYKWRLKQLNGPEGNV